MNDARALRLKIAQVGELVLRQRARPLTPEQIKSREIQELIENMRTTMYDAPGVGLAAPQIGASLQLAVIEDKPEYTKDSPSEFLKERERRPVPFHVIVNPLIIEAGGAVPEFFEGCLSLAAFTAVVPRAREVVVKCLDHKGNPKTIEATGWYARILQHEIDHLRGLIYIDRMRAGSFMSMENFNRHWKDKPMQEVRRVLDIEEKRLSITSVSNGP